MQNTPGMGDSSRGYPEAAAAKSFSLIDSVKVIPLT